jgi:DNA-binding CsgD family transcriptional regulator
MRDEIATLTLALLDGPFEEPLFGTFLEQLRIFAAADFATLIIQSPRVQVDKGTYLVAGDVSIDEVNAVFAQFSYPNNPVRRQWVREGRPYSLAEILAHDGKKFPEFFSSLSGPFGVTAAREMRIQEPSGVDAWLSIVRNGADFSQCETKLLVNIAPIFRGVLRNYVARDQDRFASEMASEAVRRLQFGWIALDASATVLRADHFGELVLANSTVLGRSKDGRLSVLPKELQAEIVNAVAKIAAGSTNRPRAIQLRGDPWLDMLIVPAQGKLLAANGAAAAIAYVHGDNWSAQDRLMQLAELFSLAPSEAKLALALCRGRTIAEASREMGITVESARTYSKSIFAKTGARGQPDLVRIIMGSILALSPDA